MFILYSYWNIPFDPLREDIVSDHMVCNTWKRNGSDEEEEQLNEVDLLINIKSSILKYIKIPE